MDYARQLLRLAQEYHKAETRQVQLKATKISAALLDAAVVDALEYLKRTSSSSSSLVCGDAASAVLSDRYVPFANRALTELGFPTDAKFDDFSRWIHIEDDSPNAPPTNVNRRQQ